MSRSVEELLRLGSEAATKSGLTFMLIGGCARNVYASPRATRDADFAVQADANTYQRLVAELRAAGFDHATVVNEENEPVPDVLLASDGKGGRVDVLFAKTDFEVEALGRRVSMPGLPAPVVTPEDLIIYKLIAGRPRDLADVHEVIVAREKQGQVLDFEHIERWAREWGFAGQLATTRAAIRRELGASQDTENDPPR